MKKCGDIDDYSQQYEKEQRRRSHTAKCSMTQFYRIFYNGIANDLDLDIGNRNICHICRLLQDIHSKHLYDLEIYL